LWAGGGVCGAIFRAAGHAKLEAACDAIGHCDTGSAVITPGFDLKSKYIIHAVGPVWRGGEQGEPELLYGAYRRSLELAAENGCKSVGFPLISSGIFGYPVDQAWDTALRACNDFLKNGNEIDIVFAVLSDNVLEIGDQVLKNLKPIRYNKRRKFYRLLCYNKSLENLSNPCYYRYIFGTGGLP
jgi:O-acetyl-ADP-ribose deacetylase (regulator of RNase III)